MKWRLEKVKEVDVEITQLPAEEMLKHWYWLIEQAEKLSKIEEAHAKGSRKGLDIAIQDAFPVSMLNSEMLNDE